MLRLVVCPWALPSPPCPPLSFPWAHIGVPWGACKVRGLWVGCTGPSSSSWPLPQSVYDRCEVLLRPPFEACHAFVSPLPFAASCTSDLCQ